MPESSVCRKFMNTVLQSTNPIEQLKYGSLLGSRSRERGFSGIPRQTKMSETGPDSTLTNPTLAGRK